MFANHVISQKTHCITFNYDDFLDNALWEWRTQYGNGRGWSPDRGYGFPCRSAQSCLQEVPPLRQPSQMLLLKLHGSLNWRVPLGYAKPSPLEVVRHHEEWSTTHTGEYRVPSD